MLVERPEGGYRYLPNVQPIAVPFSAAVVADPGFEIVHVVLDRPIPYRDGFRWVADYLTGIGRPRAALCGVELRCPAPYPLAGFQAFNVTYAELLRDRGLMDAGVGIATRTNIAPEFEPPFEQVMCGFFYAAPGDGPSTFVLSGAFEDPRVRPGDTSPDALHEKVADVVATLTLRLESAGLHWDAATDFGLYTTHDLGSALRAELLPRIASAARQGIRWYPSSPPVQGFELEIDARGVRREIRLSPGDDTGGR
jgi:hypothetical protein